MRKRTLVASGLLVSIVLADIAGADDDAPRVRRTEDIIYGRKDGMALTMDVFQPSRPNKCGIVYLVNGGWFSSKATPGMQNVTPEYYATFLDRGYTVFAVVTSSQPRYTIPDLISDSQRAVRFVRANAARFGVRADRLGITGSSSGGQLALAVATRAGPGDPDASDPVNRESSAVQAAACFFPPTDFLNFGGPEINGVGLGPMKPLQRAFGPRSETDEGRQALGKEISPIYYVTRDLPPTLIIHGDADDVVPLQQAESFVERARAVGARNVELIVRPGKGHGWPKGSIVWKSDEDMREFLDWFDRYLPGTERPTKPTADGATDREKSHLSADRHAAEPAKRVNAPHLGALGEAERKTIFAELQELQSRLDELRNSPDLSTDRWADAQIFVKGVVWALDFGPINDAGSRELVQKGLRRARDRIDALVVGRQPWAEKRGRSVRGFISRIDGSVQPYGLVVPAGYDPAKPIRLDVVLHGSTPATGIGELLFINAADGGDDGTKTSTDDFIEVHPMGRLGENAYRFEGETDVDEAIEAVCRNYEIDRARIVLRGSSLGGVGTWQLGLKRPDRFVALGPIAGPVDTYLFANAPWKHFVRLDPLTPWQKTMLHLVDAIDYTANAGMVPVVAVMGDQDPYFASHLQIEKAFAKEGIPFVGLVDVGAGHGVTSRVMQEQLALLKRHADKGRDPFPKHVRFVTWTLKFNRCQWLEVLGLKSHYQRAEIEARVAPDGSIGVTEPGNITRFAIHPPALRAADLSVSVGEMKIELPAKVSGTTVPIVIERHNGKWQYQGALDALTLTGKRPGLQGPIDDAFARPFLCVRGTGKAWNPAVGAWADASLKRFADEWRRHYRGYLPVKDDADVTDDDVRRLNLILFGDPGSNRWIRQALPQLPVRWTSDTLQLGKDRYAAADHGVQLICPNPLPGAAGRYVVLNSGHTYHDSELRFSYMVFPRLGDWAIVKVGENPPGAPAPVVSESVVDSGFFDEAWGNPVDR